MRLSDQSEEFLHLLDSPIGGAATDCDRAELRMTASCGYCLRRRERLKLLADRLNHSSGRADEHV